MNQLPLELEWIIFLYLDVESLGRLAQVASHFYHTLKTQNFWRAKCDHDYGLPNMPVDHWMGWYRETQRAARRFRGTKHWLVAAWAVRHAGMTFHRLNQLVDTNPFQLHPSIYRLHREILSFRPMDDYGVGQFRASVIQPGQFKFPMFKYSLEVCQATMIQHWFQSRNLAVDTCFNQVIFYGCLVPQSNQANIWFPLARQKPEVERHEIPPDIDHDTLSFSERADLENQIEKYDRWVENIRYDYI
jgi:hypothetical protein